MDFHEKEHDYENSKSQETGSHDLEYKTILYNFDKYQIKIKLSLTNKFMEIVEVKINKDFLSHKQKILSKGYIDVSKFYRK